MVVERRPNRSKIGSVLISERGSVSRSPPPCHSSRCGSQTRAPFSNGDTTAKPARQLQVFARCSYHSPVKWQPHLIQSGIVTKPASEVLSTTCNAVRGSPP